MQVVSQSVEVYSEDQIIHVDLPPNQVPAIAHRQRWQGRPWQPDEIPGIDPNYTWGYPSPYTHSFFVEKEHYNNTRHRRSNRAGWVDGNFITPQATDDFGTFDTDFGDLICQTLDDQWLIGVWAEEVWGAERDAGVVAQRHAALWERVGADLILRDEIILGPSGTPDDFDCRAGIDRLDANRVVIGYYKEDTGFGGSTPLGTPWMYVVRRSGNSLVVDIEHHLEADYEAFNQPENGRYLYGRAMIWGLVALTPTKFAVSWMGGADDGPGGYIGPRLTVCEIHGAGIAELGTDIAPLLGVDDREPANSPERHNPFLDDFTGMGITKLNATTLAYTVLLYFEPVGRVDNFTMFGAWNIGRIKVTGLNIEADQPQQIDHYYKSLNPLPTPPPQHIYGGGVTYGWEASGFDDNRPPPDVVRLSDTRVAVGYVRRGNVAPYHLIYDNGTIDDLPPGATGRLNIFPVPNYNPGYYGPGLHFISGQYTAIAPCIRVIDFTSPVGVDTIITKHAQHFPDIAFPTWQMPDNEGRTSRTTGAWGLTSCRIVPINESRFLCYWLQQPYTYTAGTEGVSSFPLSVGHNPTAQRQAIRARYGKPPEGTTPRAMWTLVEVDESSPSRLHSDGATNSYMYDYNEMTRTGRPCAFPNGTIAMVTNELNSGEGAPQHDGYYQYADEWIAIYSYLESNGNYLANPDIPPATVPDPAWKNVIGDPRQWRYEQRQTFLFKPGPPPSVEIIDFPGPPYVKEEDFFWYAYEGEPYSRFGMIEPVPPADDAPDEEWDAYWEAYDAFWDNLPTLDRTVNAYLIGFGNIRGAITVGPQDVQVYKEGQVQ